MRKTEETPSAPTLEAKSTEGRDIHEANSCTDIIAPWQQNINPSSTAAIILPLLRSGRGNARKRSELLEATGLSDRVLRRGIEALRRSGVVICSGEHGYYIPATVEEVNAFVRQEEARARSTFYTLRPARQLAARMQEQGEQMQLEGVR